MAIAVWCSIFGKSFDSQCNREKSLQLKTLHRKQRGWTTATPSSQHTVKAAASVALQQFWQGVMAAAGGGRGASQRLSESAKQKENNQPEVAVMAAARGGGGGASQRLRE